MNNDKTDFQQLSSLINLFQRIKQLSFIADRTGKRYPPVEALHDEEILALKRDYLALGLDIEDIYLEWKKLYEQENKKREESRK